MSPTISPQRQQALIQLIEMLGLQVTDQFNWALLDQALIHPSFSASYNNAQLEFIGDSVLKLAVTLFLKEAYGDKKVGQLSALRSHLVSDQNLAKIARAYDLSCYIVLSASIKKDTQNTQGKEQTILADSMEALIAAIYIAMGDIKFVRQWLDAHLRSCAEDLLQIPALGNYKLALLEITQRHWKCLPEYRKLDTAEDADQIFTVEVWFADRCWGQGQGKSIKSAQQAAAAIALQAIDIQKDAPRDMPKLNLTKAHAKTDPQAKVDSESP